MDLNQIIVGIKTFFHINGVNKSVKNASPKKSKTESETEDFTSNAERDGKLKEYKDQKSTRRARAIVFFIIAFVVAAFGGLSVPVISVLIGGLGITALTNAIKAYGLAVKIGEINKIIKSEQDEEKKTREKEIKAKDAKITALSKQVAANEATMAKLVKENKDLKLQLGIPITTQPPKVRIRRPAVAPALPASVAAPVQPAQTAVPVQPAPVVAPVQPEPVVAPVQPAPVVAPVQPAPVVAPVQPAPVVAPVQPAPAAAPAQPVAVAPFHLPSQADINATLNGVPASIQVAPRPAAPTAPVAPAQEAAKQEAAKQEAIRQAMAQEAIRQAIQQEVQKALAQKLTSQQPTGNPAAPDGYVGRHGRR